MDPRDIRRGSDQVYRDEQRQCVDCGLWYTWEKGEQEFFAAKRPPLAAPKRCPACRARRRATIQQPVAQCLDEYDATRHWHPLYPTRSGGRA